MASYASARLKINGLPLDGCHQPKVIQDTRTQLGGDAPHRLNGGVNPRDERLERSRKSEVGGQRSEVDAPASDLRPPTLAAQAREIQFQAGQGLPQFIVDFAGDAGPLLLTHPLQIGGQRAQLVVGVAQFSLGAFAFSPLAGLTQGPMDGGDQTRETGFQPVIGRPLLERFNGDLFTHGPGDEDERHVGTLLTGDGQGGQAVKRRQRVVGEDNVGRMGFQFADELAPPLNAFGLGAQAALAQCPFDQLGVGLVVCEHQDVNLSFHSAAEPE